MSARQCKTDPNRFCYIRGELTFSKEKRSITSHIKKIYKAYFDCYLRDQDKSSTPHVLLSYTCEGIECLLCRKKCSHKV